jgi:hypothetical protein
MSVILKEYIQLSGQKFILYLCNKIAFLLSLKDSTQNAKFLLSFQWSPVQIVVLYVYLYITLTSNINTLHITTFFIILQKNDKVT